MGQYDIARSGANPSETVLNQTTVAASNFTKLGAWSVTGKPWGQPLIAPGIVIGGTTYTLLIVVTSTNTVYAFNASAAPGTPALWSLSLGTPYASGDNNFYDGNIGITSTPAIDSSTKVLYFVSCNSSGAYSIYGVNLADGSTYAGPTTISGSSGGMTFTSTSQAQRPALLILSGNVYVAFGSYGDTGTWNGWIFAYSESALAQTAVFVSSPTVNKSSFWMAGGGLSSDGTNIWGVTGNDSSAAAPTDYGESFIELSPSLSVQDYMQPSNYATLDSGDLDMGSSRAMIIGNYVMGGGKDGRFWVLNKGAMGSNQGSGPPIAQVWQLTVSEKMYDGYVQYNGNVWVPIFAYGGVGPIYALSCPSTCNETPAATSSETFTYQTLAYSSNGTASGSGVLWAQTAQANANNIAVPGVFYAFNPNTLTVLYSDSSMGYLAKFTMPTIANGRVYLATLGPLGTNGTVNVYGIQATTGGSTGAGAMGGAVSH